MWTKDSIREAVIQENNGFLGFDLPALCVHYQQYAHQMGIAERTHSLSALTQHTYEQHIHDFDKIGLILHGVATSITDITHLVNAPLHGQPSLNDRYIADTLNVFVLVVEEGHHNLYFIVSYDDNQPTLHSLLFNKEVYLQRQAKKARIQQLFTKHA